MLICSMLGNPFGGLYFPERMLGADVLPWYYSFGTKIAAYFVLGFFCQFMSQYVSWRARREASEGGRSWAEARAREAA